MMVLLSEWTKLRALRSTYVTLLVTAVTALIASGIVAASTASVQASQAPPFGAVAGIFAGWLSYPALAVGVLGIITITAEYGTGQIRLTFTAVPRRLTVLAAKAAVTGLTGLVLGEVLAFAGYGVTAAALAGHPWRGPVRGEHPRACRRPQPVCGHLAGPGHRHDLSAHGRRDRRAARLAVPAADRVHNAGPLEGRDRPVHPGRGCVPAGQRPPVRPAVLTGPVFDCHARLAGRYPGPRRRRHRLSLRWFEPNTCHHLRRRPASWEFSAMRAVFALSRGVSPCSAKGRCVAVSTDG
jgi:hypothetical protein